MKISKQTSAAYRALTKGDKSHIFVLVGYQGISKRTIHRMLKRERDIKELEWDILRPVLSRYLPDEPTLEAEVKPHQLRIQAPTTLMARAKAYGKEARRKVQEYHDTKLA
jgi:hypothetical protein